MKKFEGFLTWAAFIFALIFVLSFICFLGAEPETWNEESVSENFYAKGNLGWYLGWTALVSFCLSFGSFVGIIKIDTKNKPQTF